MNVSYSEKEDFICRQMANIIKNILLLVSIFFIFQISRILLLFHFNENNDAPSALFWLLSARFDLMTATYLVLPTTILTVISIFVNRCFRILMLVYATSVVFIVSLLGFVNFCFFQEYKSQFNFWIWGLFQDQTDVIVSNIISEYPVFYILFGLLVALILIFRVFKYLYGKIDSLGFRCNNKLSNRIAYSFVIIFTVIILLRGGKLTGAPFRISDISTLESSRFLNNLIPNYVYCLKQEIFNAFSAAYSDNLKYFRAERKDIPKYCKDVFCKTGDLDFSISHAAGGSPLKNLPTRIFFILSESYSAWPLWTYNSDYGLSPEMKRLSLSRGIYCDSALPAAMGTMNTTTSIIRNVPFSGANLVKRTTKCAKDISLPNTLKRLGFSSVFYYAGTSTWCDLGDTALYYGFDRFVGAELMGVKYKVSDNAWGIRDDELFNFIENSDIPENSFNFILTASNHAPFNINLKEEGLKKIIANKTENQVYHLWYADKCIGNFCNSILKKYPNSIIVITGDHPARCKPETAKFGEKEQALVPILIFGPPFDKAGIKIKIRNASHMNILPTLVELISPKGFEYKAFENSMLITSKNAAMNPYFVADDRRIYSLESSDCPASLRDFARKYFALSYYYATKENEK